MKRKCLIPDKTHLHGKMLSFLCVKVGKVLGGQPVAAIAAAIRVVVEVFGADVAFQVGTRHRGVTQRAHHIAHRRRTVHSFFTDGQINLKLRKSQF
jgi:hypothetical protein